MGGKWRWLLYAFVAWEFVRIIWGALSVPWTWTMDQDALVFWALCLPVGIVTWARIWKQGGVAAIKDRWRQVDKAMSDKKRFWRWFWIWMAVAIALVVFQTVMHPHGP